MAATSPQGYPNVVFSDGFESGSLAAWDGVQGTGSASVGPFQHTGQNGLRLTNRRGQTVLVSKRLTSSWADSSVSFSMRLSSPQGLQYVAQALDQASSTHMWDLFYDGNQRSFTLRAFRGSTITSISTGANSAPGSGTWMKVEVQYAATASGGAQLYINDQTNASWGLSGDYTRATNFQTLQLWNDTTSKTDFDDVVIATPPVPPSAPTGVTGSARDQAVALTWTPASNGGSAITGYRVTPYVGGTAQTPVLTGSAATTYTVSGLANGTEYTFTVAAITAVGTSPESAASAPVTPVTRPPDAPTAVSGTRGDASVSLTWTAPAYDGGSPITGYRVTPYVGTTAQTPRLTDSTATSSTVTGLTNGTTYTFRVAAINAVGTGADSAASASVTPVAAPGAPTGVSGTRGNTSVSLTWTSPASNGGSAITGYRVTAYVGGTAQSPRLTGSTATSYTVTGLTNGTAYTFTVAAINAIGTGPESAASAPVTPATTPGAPTGVSGTRGDASVSLTWTAPSSDGGSAITGYRVTPYIGANAQTPRLTGSAATSYTVTGLTNGQKYTFRVAAINAVGTGPDSAASAGVTPAPAPGAPTGVSGTPGNASVSLTWTSPAPNGGSAITGYRVTPYVAGTAQTPVLTGSTATTYAVTGLTNGTAYSFTVAAINAVGTGPDSVASAPVTPATTPGPPTGVSGTRGNASVSLTWTAPSSNGGSAISGYRVTPYIGAAAQTPVLTGSAATNYTVTGLTNGTAYTFTLAAINAVGRGPESVASGPVTPVATAGAPTGLTATPGDGAVLLMWTAPASNGGSAITGYRVTPYAAGTAQTPVLTGSSATTYAVTGLTNGTAYSFTVAAINAIGTGPDSAASAPVTPATMPGPPTGVSGTRGNASVSLTWSAPASDGGSAITGYRVTPYIGAAAQTPVLTGSAATNYTVTGLTNGTAYTFTLAAINAVGRGPESAASDPVTPLGTPGAPTGLTATPGEGAVLLMWTAPASNGGSAITDYRVTPYVAGTAQTPVLTGSSATTYAVTGLTNGTAYTFTVAAINAIGTGSESAASAPVTPATTPDAPTAVTGSSRDGGIALSWTAPASDGGKAISGYRITPYVDGTAQTPVLTGSAATSFTVTGLTNGTAYTFTVAAINAVGRGPESAACDPVMATATASAPTGVSGTSQDGAVALTWTAPTSDGGAAITDYRITPYVAGTVQAPVLTGSAATSFTVTGLTNGTAYAFTVAAINAMGTGPESTASAPITPATTPGAPTAVSGSSRVAAVALTWTAPTSDGGSAITDYRVTPSVDGTPQTPVLTGSSATSYTVTGLTNGTAYTFTVAAINAVGRGPESAASDPVVPAATAQTVVSLTFDDDHASQYTMRQPLLDHGMRATFYVNSGLTGDLPAWRMGWSQLTALASDGNEIAGHSLTHADLTRLTPEQQRHEVCDDRLNLIDHGFSPVSFAYPFGAYEQNDVETTVRQCGYSSARIASGIHTSICPTCPYAESLPPRDRLVIRTAPHNETFEGMKSDVLDARANGGGWLVFVFHYVCDGCSNEFVVKPSELTAFLDWLQTQAADGTVVKTVGEVMADVPPPADATLPGSPTNVVGSRRDGAVAVTWSPPHATGGTALTGYRVTPYVDGSPRPAVVTGSIATAYTVTGLDNGTEYTFTVAAINAVGAGDESVASAPVTPGPPTLPGAPTDVSGAARDRAVTLTWTAPTSDGGGAITGYRVTPYVGGSAQTPVLTDSPVTSYTVTGLANDTAYTFTVAAINAIGAGPESDPSAAVTPAPPPPPAPPGPMPLVSRGVPAYTNDACAGSRPASNANDSNYATLWRTCDSTVSPTSPKWLAYDLSTVPAAERATVLVAWYNDPSTIAFDHTVFNTRAYNIPATYTIELNAAPGGTEPPTTGWRVDTSVSDNFYNSRQHEVDMTGYNWLRINVTASDGSVQNADVALNMDVHDASAGLSDSWIFYGDAITQDGLLHDNRVSASGALVGTFAQLVNNLNPAYFPAFQDGGVDGISSATAASRMSTWLPLFPGNYVALAYGTSDALAPADPAIADSFHQNMRTMIDAVLAVGKTPILPAIPWGRHARLAANVPALNSAINTLLTEYPNAVRGPDLYTLFSTHQDLISSDGVHPTDAGYAALRQEWANFAAAAFDQ